ncbi:hypothetical protein SUGI_0807340 [Cryptomeria japonica]|nr:hypothetical protein SUGI_0807340 [Cryptomeria japonica]
MVEAILTEHPFKNKGILSFLSIVLITGFLSKMAANSRSTVVLLLWLTVVSFMWVSSCSARPLQAAINGGHHEESRNSVEVTLKLEDNTVKFQNPYKFIYAMLPKGKVPVSGPSPITHKSRGD